MNNYIYAHLDDGEPVYIGKGAGGRAWDSRPSTRTNPNHLEWMMSKLPENLDVQVIASNITKDEALSLERQLIFELRPKFNKGIPVYKTQTEAKRKTKWRK